MSSQTPAVSAAPSPTPPTMDADQDTSRYLQVEESDDSYASVASLLAATAEEKSLSPIPGISVPGSPSPTPPAEFPTVSPESVICLEERPPPYIPPPPGPPGQDLGVEVEELEERSIHSFTRGDYKEALACFERCLQIRIKTFGPMHASVASTYFNLGNCLKSLGQYADAAAQFEKCLEIRLQAPETLQTAATYASIGSCMKHEQRYRAAIRNYELCLQIRIQILGVEHSDSKRALQTINRLRRRLERYNRDQEAAKVAERAAVEPKAKGGRCCVIS